MPYELVDEEIKTPESTLGYGLRTGARTLARAGEAVAGLPGDILSGIMGLGSYASGGIIPSMEKIQEKLPFVTPPPTSQQIREQGTKHYTGEYLEPQSPFEESYDQIIGDATQMLLPGIGKGKVLTKIGGALAKSTLGNVAQWATENVTGSKLLGDVAKIGAIGLANSFGGRKAIENIKNEKYDLAKKALPETPIIDAAPELKTFNEFSQNFTRGAIKDKNWFKDQITDMKEMIGDSNIVDIKGVIDLKKQWNELLNDSSLSANQSRFLKHGIKNLKNIIKRFGKDEPEFYKNFLEGEELTAALRSSNIVQDVMAKHPSLQKYNKNPIIKNLFGLGMAGSLGYGVAKGIIGLPVAAAVGTTALGVREAAKAYQLLTKSPIARRYYKNAISAGLNNDIKAMTKDLSKLDKATKQFSTEPESTNQPKARYELVED